MRNEELPKFESFKRTLIRKHGSLWNLRKFDYPQGRFDVYWKICYRVLENNIGKSFDMAFHYYCTLVPKNFQYLFLEKFDDSKVYWRHSYYSLDDNNNIVYHPFRWSKKEAVFYTDDYKTETFHKIIGKPWDAYQKNSFKRLFSSKFIEESKKKNLWEDKVVSGQKLVFSSTKDPLYKRLTTDRLKKQKAALRKKKKKFTDEEVKVILRERGKKEKEENKLKIEAHGFSPELSFRKHDVR